MLASDFVEDEARTLYTTALERSTMSIATITDPIAEVIAKAEQREADEALRIQMEIESFRRNREEADNKARQEKLVENVRQMVFGLKSEFATHVDRNNWRVGGIKDGAAYIDALIHIKDRPLPSIDPGIIKVIQRKFVAAIYRYRDVIPKGFLVGQRQDWFEPLFVEFSQNKSFK
jgi:hypothetical protein